MSRDSRQFGLFLACYLPTLFAVAIFLEPVKDNDTNAKEVYALFEGNENDSSLLKDLNECKAAFTSVIS